MVGGVFSRLRCGWLWELRREMSGGSKKGDGGGGRK